MLKPGATVLALPKRLSGAEFTPPSPWVQSLFEAYGFGTGARLLTKLRKSRRDRMFLDSARLFKAWPRRADMSLLTERIF